MITTMGELESKVCDICGVEIKQPFIENLCLLEIKGVREPEYLRVCKKCHKEHKDYISRM